MANKILTEVSRTTEVSATAKNGDFEYNVNYSYVGDSLKRLSVQINKVSALGEEKTYSGYMGYEGGNKTTSFPLDVEMSPHILMFEAIIKEVEDSIKVV